MSRAPDHPAPTWTITDDDAPVPDDAICAMASLLLETVEEGEKQAGRCDRFPVGVVGAGVANRDGRRP